MDPSSHPACRRVRGVSGVTASVGIGRKSEVEVGSPSGLVVSGMSKVAGACILVQCVVWTGCRRPGAGPGCRCGLVCAGKIRRSVENKKKSKKNPDSRSRSRLVKNPISFGRWMARRVSTGPGVENASRLACFHEAKRKIKTARPPPLGASVCSLRVPATHGTWCFKCLRLCSGVPHGVDGCGVCRLHCPGP